MSGGPSPSCSTTRSFRRRASSGRSPAARARFPGASASEQANNLAILLRAGALPAKLNIVEERTVGPGLGQDSIDAGKRAAYWAAALVVTYMLITYGVFGIFANIALADPYLRSSSPRSCCCARL